MSATRPVNMSNIAVAVIVTTAVPDGETMVNRMIASLFGSSPGRSGEGDVSKSMLVRIGSLSSSI